MDPNPNPNPNPNTDPNPNHEFDPKLPPNDPRQPLRKKKRATVPEHINDKEARLAKKMQSVVKENQGALSHLSYMCPGLHGPGTRTDVTMVKFEAVFGPLAPPILIPLFQRTYCWEDQIAGWWRDLIGAAMSEHRVGKIIFKASETEKKRALVCVDGQQRITTQQLFLSGLRDAALFLKELVVSSSSPSASLLAQVNVFLNNVNSYLYRDVGQCRRWIKRRRNEKKGSQEEGFFLLGEKVEFCTLLPSFCDRLPFFELVTRGMLYDLEREEQGWKPELREKSQVETLGLNLQFPEQAKATLMGRAKGIFDQQILEFVFGSNRSEFSPDLLKEALQKLRQLGKNAINNMIIARIEIMNPINYAQVFLWFQEKSLFSAGGVLVHNPSPGVSFRAIDLVRNLILSPFMNYSLSHQEALYRKYWLGPIELRLGTKTARLDAFLNTFLEGKRSQSERYVGSFEGRIICMKESNILPANYTTPLLYGRFHSYYEQTEGNYTPDLEKSLRAEMESMDIFLDETEEKNASLKTSFLVLRELSSFAVDFDEHDGESS